MTRPTGLPRFVFHWTHARDVASIAATGLRPSPGGWMGQHDGEPAVALTLTGDDPAQNWNSNIFWILRPVRLTIDLDRLPGAFGPGLNSLLEEGVAEWAAQRGVDVGDPSQQTLAFDRIHR